MVAELTVAEAHNLISAGHALHEAGLIPTAELTALINRIADRTVDNDCKFCEFPHLDPTIYDAPESVKAHALHLLERMTDDATWDEQIKRVGVFSK